MGPIYYVLIALPCTIGAMALAILHIYNHLVNYTEPTYQRYIVRIIFMVPVYALMSFLSLVQPESTIYFNSIREMSVQCALNGNMYTWINRHFNEFERISRHFNEFEIECACIIQVVGLCLLTLQYEAWVIYNFLSLCLAWVGGPGAVVVSLFGKVLKPNWCLMTCCFPPIPLDGRFIRRCKQGCLQFVILKPILVVVTLILYAKGKYEDGNFNPLQSYLYLTIIYTFSYSLALYALAVFYMACRDLLLPFNPVPKFIMIKSVVFLTYWQGVLVFLAAKSGFIKDTNAAAEFQNFIICVEMLIAAVGHLYAFPYREYAGANVGANPGFTASLLHSLKLNDLYHDTVHQFAPTYHEYVLYNPSEGDDGGRKYRSRTFVPTGQEMDAVRSSNKDVLENKLDGISTTANGPPPNSGSTKKSEAVSSSLLVDGAVSVPYDLTVIDLNLSDYPTQIQSVRQ